MVKLLNKFKSALYAVLAVFTGKNYLNTPVGVIRAQMLEKRPLPIGKTEFMEWSDRIISGCVIPGLSEDSIRFALADQVLHLGPTEDHKEDAFFIHAIRKLAVNQTVDEMRKQIRDEAKARLEAQEEAAKNLLPKIFPKTDAVTSSPQETVTDEKVAK